MFKPKCGICGTDQERLEEYASPCYTRTGLKWSVANMCPSCIQKSKRKQAQQGVRVG